MVDETLAKGRSTVYNKITSPIKLEEVNPKNKELQEEFLEYLDTIGRAKSTIMQYEQMLNVFFVWNMENNKNKYFIDLNKRDFMKFQNYGINEYGWSPARVRTVRAALSSLSNFVTDILDDEFPDYKSSVKKIEAPINTQVRTKTVFSLEELQRLLDHLVENKKYMKAAILALMMFSGRRKAEITRFKVSYFDKENLICGNALYMTPEPLRTKGRGRNGKMLTVYVLAKQFEPYLRMWMKYREENGIESEWLFPNANDPSRTIGVEVIDSFSDEFTKFLGKPWYPHSMRSFYTTYLLEQNIPEDVVTTIIGWSTRDQISTYDLRTKESQLDKYFGADGIKQVEKKSLDDL